MECKLTSTINSVATKLIILNTEKLAVGICCNLRG